MLRLAYVMWGWVLLVAAVLFVCGGVYFAVTSSGWASSMSSSLAAAPLGRRRLFSHLVRVDREMPSRSAMPCWLRLRYSLSSLMRFPMLPLR